MDDRKAYGDTHMKTILVMSGKGGVGKTTIATNIAQYLAEQGNKTGLLDVDIHGPNVLKLLGIPNAEIYSQQGKMIPIQYNENLKVVSIAAIMDEALATIWRGPVKHKVIQQLIQEVHWGDLDYLILDFPPGTGDEHISAVQLLKEITGTIIISTPQSMALADVRRGIDFCKKMNVPILGAVENMSGNIFGTNKVEPFCKKEKIDFLGTISLQKEIASCEEKGKLFYKEKNETIQKEFEQLMKNIISKVNI